MLSTLKPIHTRSVAQGAVFYFARHAIVTGGGLVANLYIIKALEPGQLGYIAIVNIFIALLTIVSDGGLTVYLIKHDGVVDEALRGYFFRTQVKVCGVVLALMPIIYVTFIFWELDITVLNYLFVISLSVIPSLLRGQNFVVLERNLDFRRIASIEISESFVFSAGSMILVSIGMGVWSIVLAHLAKAFVGLLLSPNPFKLVRSGCGRSVENRQLLGTAWRFGIGYHATAVVGILRNVANPSIMGALYGPSVVGICDRATYIAGIPCSLIGTIQSRLLFPLYSLIQNNQAEASRILGRSIFISGIVDKFLYMPIIVASDYMPQILGGQWVDAVLVVKIMAWGNLLFGVLISSYTPFLAALGKPGWLARLSIFSTLVSWLLMFPLAQCYGQLGYAYVSVINWFPLLVVVYMACKRWSVNGVMIKWLIPALAAAGAVCLMDLIKIGGAKCIWVEVISKTLCVYAAYVVLLFALGPRVIIAEVKNAFKQIYVHGCAAG